MILKSEHLKTLSVSMVFYSKILKKLRFWMISKNENLKTLSVSMLFKGKTMIFTYIAAPDQPKT